MTTATGSAGDCASAIGSRRATEVRDQCRNFVCVSRTNRHFATCPFNAGRSKYYKGKISRVRADATFDIAYDDGESETRVEERLIRSLDGGGRSRSPSPRGGGRGRLREGAKIEARYRGRSRFYPGRIARDRGDGTYDVDCA